MNAMRKLIEDTALSNAIAVWRGKKCVGKSPIHLIFVNEVNCKLRFRINVNVGEASDERMEEIYFNAGRKIEKFLEATGRFQIERVQPDPVVWDGREFLACPLVDLRNLVRQEDAA